MPYPSHSSRFYHLHDSGWGVHTVTIVSKYLNDSVK
jgi:hypothetical protein